MLRECKVAEPEEAQEHANRTLALCAPTKTPEDLWLTSLRSPGYVPGKIRQPDVSPRVLHQEFRAGQFHQQTFTASIETDPPSTPSTGNVTGSDDVRVGTANSASLPS
jgi:hypothetical protein